MYFCVNNVCKGYLLQYFSRYYVTIIVYNMTYFQVQIKRMYINTNIFLIFYISILDLFSKNALGKQLINNCGGLLHIFSLYIKYLNK